MPYSHLQIGDSPGYINQGHKYMVELLDINKKKTSNTKYIIKFCTVIYVLLHIYGRTQAILQDTTGALLQKQRTKTECQNHCQSNRMHMKIRPYREHTPINYTKIQADNKFSVHRDMDASSDTSRSTNKKAPKVTYIIILHALRTQKTLTMQKMFSHVQNAYLFGNFILKSEEVDTQKKSTLNYFKCKTKLHSNTQT